MNYVIEPMRKRSKERTERNHDSVRKTGKTRENNHKYVWRLKNKKAA